MRRLLLALPVALCACGPGLIMPPAEFRHPFAGELVEHDLPAGAWSVSIRSDALQDGYFGRRPRCDVYLPRADAFVSPQLRADLSLIELGNCNGWAARDGDINARRP